MEERLSARSLESLQGKILGKYRIDQQVGGGGQAVVYKALHIEFATPVALKLLVERATESPLLRERFKREARLQFKLQHPNIVRVFEVIEEDGLFGMVMDWVDGGDLEGYLASHPQPFSNAQIERLFLPVLYAVEEAHKQNIIHRDLKPSNILLGGAVGREIPKVMDFGIAKSLEDDSQHTKTNALLGTPHYIAPEHAASSKHVDHRVDIYALGVTLYQLLCGHLPFAGKDLVQLITAHLTQDPPPMRSWGVDVPPLLEHIARKALEKRPDARFQTCDDFAEALKAALRGDAATVQRYLGASFVALQPQEAVQGVLPTGEMDAYANTPMGFASLADAVPPMEPSLSAASSSVASQTTASSSAVALQPAESSAAALPSPMPTRFFVVGFFVLLVLVSGVAGAFVVSMFRNTQPSEPSKRPRMANTSDALPTKRRETVPILSPTPQANTSAKTQSPSVNRSDTSAKTQTQSANQADTSAKAQTPPTIQAGTSASKRPMLSSVASAAGTPTARVASAPPLAIEQVKKNKPVRRLRKLRSRVRKSPYKPNPYLLLEPVAEKRFSSCPDCLHAFWLARKSFRDEVCKAKVLKVAARRCVRVCKQDMDFCTSYAIVLPYLYPSALRRGGSEKIEDHIDKCRYNILHHFDPILLQSGYQSGVSLAPERCSGRFLRYIRGRLASQGRKSRFAWSPDDHYPYLP